MATRRVIVRLDVKGPNLVKGIRLEGLRVLGTPAEFARRYYAEGADELLYMDVVASLYGRNSLLEVVRATAREAFIPLGVGGGLRSLEDITEALRAGADKVVVNTAALRRPELVREAARRFGSSTVVVAIEAIRQPDGRWIAHMDNGRESSGRDALEWAREAEELGAGELLVTSVDREGTGEGFDLELIGAVSERAGIPVIAHGGAGRLAHVSEVLERTSAASVALASLLHYEQVARADPPAGDPREGNTEFLRARRGFKKVEPRSLREVKEHLAARGIPCRPWTAPGAT